MLTTQQSSTENTTGNTKSVSGISSPTMMFKALGDETRLKIILLILRETELCVCELVTALDVDQPKISRHLALLKKQGLLSDRKEKQWVFYQVSKDLTNWQNRLFAELNDTSENWITDEITRLETMGNRPIRQSTCCN